MNCYSEADKKFKELQVICNKTESPNTTQKQESSPEKRSAPTPEKRSTPKPEPSPYEPSPYEPSPYEPEPKSQLIEPENDLKIQQNKKEADIFMKGLQNDVKGYDNYIQEQIKGQDEFLSSQNKYTENIKDIQEKEDELKMNISLNKIKRDIQSLEKMGDTRGAKSLSDEYDKANYYFQKQKLDKQKELEYIKREIEKQKLLVKNEHRVELAELENEYYRLKSQLSLEHASELQEIDAATQELELNQSGGKKYIGGGILKSDLAKQNIISQVLQLISDDNLSKDIKENIKNNIDKLDINKDKPIVNKDEPVVNKDKPLNQINDLNNPLNKLPPDNQENIQNSLNKLEKDLILEDEELRKKFLNNQKGGEELAKENLDMKNNSKEDQFLEEPPPLEEPLPQEQPPLVEPVSQESPPPLEEPVPQEPLPLVEPMPQESPPPLEEPVPQEPPPLEKPVPLNDMPFEKEILKNTYNLLNMEDKKNETMNITNYLVPDCNIIRNDILNGRIKKENFSYLSSKCNNSIQSIL